MAPFSFFHLDQFLDREEERAALDRWWEDETSDPVLILQGRRRVGKSWLFRRFAHGKDATILVADRRVLRDQLTRFGAELQDQTRFPVALRTASDLFDWLFELGRDGRRLAVIDEFPELLGGRGSADSELAAVLEKYAGRSQTKLILAGSQMSVMERLLGARRALHGRARKMLVRPLRFDQARLFLEAHSEHDLIERYAIAGGMPRYLATFGARSPLEHLFVKELLDPIGGPLFDEPRTVLEMELSESAIYFSILSALADHRELALGDLIAESGVGNRGTVSRYLSTLQDLHLVRASDPVFAQTGGRQHRYRIADNLVRTWFAFVFPYQASLASGLDAAAFYDRVVRPRLPEHVSWAFEDICRDWMLRRSEIQAEEVGAWWGPALNRLRRTGGRTTEEIDLVARSGRRVLAVGEVKWTRSPMSPVVLSDLRQLKMPALAQTGADLSDARVFLFSRSGFHPSLKTESLAAGVELVDLPRLLA